ncbi:MAG: PKD domain-containing protein, partial [Arenicellales bacterium]
MFRSNTILLIFSFFIVQTAIADVESLIPNFFSGPGFKSDRAYSGETTNENIDTNTGILIVNHSDLVVPGGNGLEIRVQRNYSSAAMNSRSVLGAAAPYPAKFLNSKSPIGLGWTMHLGRISLAGEVGFVDICNKNLEFLEDTMLDNAVLELADGSQQPLLVSVGESSGPLYSYDFQTRDELWSADCINSGEGLRVYGPNGVQYEMTHMISSPITQYSTRTINTWYPVNISTAYGDSITVTYSGQIDNNALISTIERNDGARVDFSYSELFDSGGNAIPSTKHLSQISFQGKVWNYDYTSITQNNLDTRVQLTKVTGPEGLVWEYGYYPLQDLNANQALMKQVTHPYGGVTDYTYKYVDFWGPNSLVAFAEKFFTISVATKSISGPDVVPATWTYDYQPSYPYNTSTVSGPDSLTTYKYIGGQYTNDPNFFPSFNQKGLLLERAVYDKSNNLLLKETNTYGARGTITDIDPIGPIHTDSGYLVSNERDTHPSYYNDSIKAWFNLVLKKTLLKKEIQVDGTSYITEYGHFGYAFQPQTLIETGQGTRTRGLRYCTDADIKLHARTYVTYEIIDDLTKTVNTCDRLGRKVLQYTDGVITDYEYATAGPELLTANPIAKIDGRNKRWSYSDYKFGIPQTESLPDGNTISRTVSDRGEITSETDQNGNTSSYVYDNLSRVISLILPKGQSQPVDQTVNVTRDYAARETVYTRGSQRYEVVFNGFGQAVRINDNGIERLFTHDALGRKTFESYPGRTVTGSTFRYDPLGRIVEKSLTSGQTTTFEYLPDNRTRVTDESGNVAVLHYRSYGDINQDRSLIKVEYPEAITLELQRNLLSRVTEINIGGPGGITRTLNYQSNQAFLSGEIHPETSPVNYTRDGLGNVVRSRTNPNQSILYSYDEVSRLIKKEYVNSEFILVGGQLVSVDFPVEPPTQYEYDLKGNIKKVTRDTIVKEYFYDENDNLLREVHDLAGKIYTVEYQYNSLDQLASLTYPSGRVVTYNPDLFGRPTQASGFVNLVEYHPNGIISMMEYANGSVFQTTLNEREQPAQLSAVSAAQPEDLMNLEYFYDASSNISSILDTVDSNGSKTFQYDGVHRLISAVGSWGNGIIDYDAVGNISNKTIGTEAISYSYGTNNLLASTSGALPGNYNYDRYGNQLGTGTDQFTYDRENNLIRYSNSQTAVDYVYDGNNRLAYKEKGGTRKYFIYTKGGELLGEYDDASVEFEEHIYVGPRLVARANNGAAVPLSANAGPDQSVSGSMQVTLDGSGSTDGGQTVTYLWEQVTGPGVTLSSTNTVTTSFTTPSVTAATVFVFRLTVTGDGGAVSTDEVTITAQGTPLPGDTTPPVVTPPADIVAEATATLTSVSLGTATAIDDVDGSVVATADSSGPFALGIHTITWSATDQAGNMGTATQSVTVEDTTAPVLTVPVDVTVTVLAVPAAVAFGTATATDLFGPVAISNDAPAAFPSGVTIVTWTATDNNGNSVTGSQSVTVELSTSSAVSMTSPVPGSSLSSSPVTFSWETPPAGASKVQLWIGSQAGWANLLKSDFTPDQTSVSVPLVLKGTPIYVRLRTRFNDGWIDRDYVYQTIKQPAQMLAPVESTPLIDAPVTFSWEAPPFGANKVQLRVGSQPGWGNLLLSDFTLDQTSVSVAFLLKGTPVYVRLRTLFPEGWVNQDYVYQTVKKPAQMLSPVDATTLTNTPVTFSWEAPP